MELYLCSVSLDVKRSILLIARIRPSIHLKDVSMHVCRVLVIETSFFICIQLADNNCSFSVTVRPAIRR